MPENPYAPAKSDLDAPVASTAERNPSRWLAVLACLLCPVFGAGFPVLGRWRLFVGWSAGGSALYLALLGSVLFDQSALFFAFLASLFFFAMAAVVVAVRAKPGGRVPSFKRALGLIALVFVTSRMISLSVRQWVLEGFSMPSGSMFPSLYVGDHLFVKKALAISFKGLNRGDIVVFRYPKDPAVDYIKRIVALEGDVIEVREGKVILNGATLRQTPVATPCTKPEPGPCAFIAETNDRRTYLITRSLDSEAPPFGPVTVPTGHVFVMGDNRESSYDSRFWGSLPLDHVKGLGAFVWFSRPEGGPIQWDRIGRRL